MAYLAEGLCLIIAKRFSLRPRSSREDSMRNTASGDDAVPNENHLAIASGGAWHPHILLICFGSCAALSRISARERGCGPVAVPCPPCAAPPCPPPLSDPALRAPRTTLRRTRPMGARDRYWSGSWVSWIVFSHFNRMLFSKKLLF